jgi:RNA-dependent RNA polymerase
MSYKAQKPDMIEYIAMEDIQSFFVNYILSDQLGIIANSHLAKADYFESGALHGQCMRLAQLHSEAVDFPKTGKPAILSSELRAITFPDFMEKDDKSTYQSQKVLGTLYRSIKEEAFNPSTQMILDDRLYVEGYKIYVEDARNIKSTYDADIMGLMNQYGIKTEFEITSGYIMNTVTNVDKKKSRDLTKSVMDAFIPIRQHYRKLFEEEFYGEGTNVISPESRNRMKAKASAWYYVTYHPNELKGDPSESMISFPWIAYDVLCDIARRKSNSYNKSDISNVNNQQKKLYKNTVDFLPNANEDINVDYVDLRKLRKMCN